MFRGMSFFLGYGWKNKKSWFFLTALAELIRATMTFIRILLPKYILDEVFGNRQIDKVIFYLVCFLGCSLFSEIFYNMLKSFSDTALDDMRKSFECSVLEKHMDCNYIKLESRLFQNLKARATQYINGPWNRFGYLGERMFALLGNMVTLFSVLFLVAKLSPFVLLVYITLVSINACVGSKLKAKKMKCIGEFAPLLRRRAYYEDISKNPAFAKEIRTFGLTEFILDKYDYHMQNFCKKTESVYKSDLWQKIVAAIMTFLQEVASYGYLIWRAFQGIITIGDFSMYVGATTSFGRILSESVDIVLEMAHYTAFYDDFKKYIDLPCESCENARGYIESLQTPEIEFKGVSFTYPGQKAPALKDISVKIGAGQKVAVVGENGAGKTTFIKLVCRLYNPDEGQILINGVDIRNVDYNQYMRTISAVFQDFYIFKKSIRENIVLNYENCNSEKIEKAIDDIGLRETISKYEQGLDTSLYKDFDKHGIVLSGGDAQRLAICRALYKNAPIVILDEPTASLDPRIEYDLYGRFLNMVQNKTVLFVSHRLTNAKLCDKVIVFKEGRIAEYGMHEELIRKQGLYYAYYSTQANYYKSGKT